MLEKGVKVWQAALRGCHLQDGELNQFNLVRRANLIVLFVVDAQRSELVVIEEANDGGDAQFLFQKSYVKIQAAVMGFVVSALGELLSRAVDESKQPEMLEARCIREELLRNDHAAFNGSCVEDNDLRLAILLSCFLLHHGEFARGMLQLSQQRSVVTQKID